MSINPTLIDWAKNPDGTQGYTWNPITGCLNGCEYCYARRLANTRLKSLYLANDNVAPSPRGHRYQTSGETNVILAGDYADPFYPRFWPEKLKELDCFSAINEPNFLKRLPRKAKGIFVCNMSDLFGIGVPEEWTREILDAISYADMYRFYLLTKQPQNLPQWSPFPDNCWVGVTATNDKSYREAIVALSQIEVKTKYLSLEPLLERISFSPTWELDAPPRALDWVIIGACTGTNFEMGRLTEKYSGLTLMKSGNKWTAQPQIEWVSEIVEAADKAGIPVFLKENLVPMIADSLDPRKMILDPDGIHLMQEMPSGWYV